MTLIADLARCPKCKAPKFFSAGQAPQYTACTNLGFQRADAGVKPVPPCGNFYEVEASRVAVSWAE